jgi:hypothetical protein
MSTFTISDSPSRITVASISNLSQLSKSLECLSLSEVAEPDLYDADAGKKYNIRVCAYALNTGCFLEGIETEGTETEGNLRENQFVSYNHYYPYLQFLVTKNDTEMGFPVLEYICPSGIVEEGGASTEDTSTDETSTEGARIKDECIQHVLDTLLLPDTDVHMNNRSIIDTFKGFVRSTGTSSKGTPTDEGTPTNEETVYVMIDLTLFQMDVRPEMKWAIVDELVYKKSVSGDTISKDVASFFNKYDCMGLLHTADEMRAELPFPFQVYMCRKTQDGGYSNVLMSDSESEYLIEHEKYGVGYLFTSEPDFLGGNTMEKLRRYAMFVANCAYVLPETGTPSLVSETQEEETTPYLFSTTVYFVENGVQMWFVKNALHFKSII